MYVALAAVPISAPGARRAWFASTGDIEAHKNVEIKTPEIACDHRLAFLCLGECIVENMLFLSFITDLKKRQSIKMPTKRHIEWGHFQISE
jgi:hypothetical protein